MTPHSLATERLRLRLLTDDDFEPFCQAIIDDPLVMRFYHKYTDDLDAATRRRMARRDFFDHFAEGLEKGYRVWAVESSGAHDLGPAGRFLGWCGITTAELDEDAWGPEMQCMLVSDIHSKGVATEACRAVIEDAFENGLRRVHAVFDRPNIGSQRIVEKMGFTRQGDVRVYDSDDMVLFTLDADAA